MKDRYLAAIDRLIARVHTPAGAERLYGIAGFAAGVAVSAIIAFVFFILTPKLSPSTPSQPAVSETTSTIAAPGGDKTTPEESEALLRKFMQWQQKQ